jgi:hypothetical protein
MNRERLRGRAPAHENPHMRLEVALRSPLAFRAPGLPTVEAIEASPEAAAIRFEGREFVWHPPFNVDDVLGHSEYGPMLVAVYEHEDERQEVARALQRFMSAASYLYAQPVEDAGYGSTAGSGVSDPFNPHGHRVAKAHLLLFKSDAPAELVVHAGDGDEDALRLALAACREATNAGSPFYQCLAFRNVLDAVYAVREEKRDGAVTAEAAARDAFVESSAAAVARGMGRETPSRGWADYMRDEVRNALSHVIRESGRVQVNPDDPTDRVRLRNDAPLMAYLARAAIETRWPRAVLAVPRGD